MASLQVLQVTDCHLFADATVLKNGLQTSATLRAVLEEALSERTPDVLLATGDLIQDSLRETYALFLELVHEQYDGPMLAIPGNHDLDEWFREMLPTSSIEANGWSLVGLDTHTDGIVSGTVSAERLMDLESELNETSGFVLVTGHHPVRDIGVAWLDAHKVENGEEIVSLVERCSRVRVYLSGHVHQESDRTHNGIRYLSTPSTCWQFGSDSDGFSLDERPPGWRWLDLHEDGTIDTQVHRLSAPT